MIWRCFFGSIKLPPPEENVKEAMGESTPPGQPTGGKELDDITKAATAADKDTVELGDDFPPLSALKDGLLK